MKKNNDYNKDDIPLTDLDYKGVIYEPSKNNSINNKKNYSKKSVNYNKKKKIAQNFNYSYFLIATICLSVVIFSTIFFLTYHSISDYFDFDYKKSPINMQNQEIVSELDENTNKVSTGILKDINIDETTINILDLNTNKDYNLKINSSSELKDKFENNISILEFLKGDIVDFSFDSTNKLTYMKKSIETFFQENISNFDLDLTNNILKYNEKAYKINKNVIIYKGVIEFPLEKISSLDTLNIKGLNNEIYYIEIKKGTGSLKFINKPNLSDATLEIDRDIFKPLSEVDLINLKEGKHKIVIRDNSISPYVKEIDIFSEKETIIDLAEIQNKKGNLLINANVSDYDLYINNKIENSKDTILLPYGNYNIKIEKEGYKPFITNININKAQVSIQANLEKFEKLGKLNISSNPTEAQVFINNAFVGYTPLEYKLPYGNHNVILKKEGYLDFNLSGITIGENDSVFNITMHKKQSTTEEKTTSTTQSTIEETQSTTEFIVETVSQ